MERGKDSNIALLKTPSARILLGLVLAIGVPLVLFSNVSDYCNQKQRTLSDEDFIEIAVRQAARDMKIDGSDTSIRSFHAQHSKCCVVRKHVGSWVDTIFGFATAEVEMYYELNERAYHKVHFADDFYHQFVVINRCGDIGRTYGEGIRVLPSSAS